MKPKTNRKTTGRRDKQLTLGQHLNELRRRLTIAALAFVVGTGLVFAITPRLFDLLLIPVGDIDLIFI
ncbi:MAG: twin-arginine translocase subunit TatC, partial [Dehalococcoidia bacterium]|nr:twin-arginine translocase subunit TatC [Dehalococcoidia bacterium]